MFSRTTSVVLSLFVLTFRDEYAHARELDGRGRADRSEPARAGTRRVETDQAPSRSVDSVPPSRRGPRPQAVRGESLLHPGDHEDAPGQEEDRRAEAEGGDPRPTNIEAGIPETIQGIIMARIDRLQDSIKEVLFGASVIGREFSAPPAGAGGASGSTDLQPNLDELRSLELILQKDEAREFDYLFKHFLIQEVAYNTILVNKRKELHASIARAIEKLYRGPAHGVLRAPGVPLRKGGEVGQGGGVPQPLGAQGGADVLRTRNPREFFERREVAVKKLYQSASARADLLAMMKAIMPPLSPCSFRSSRSSYRHLVGTLCERHGSAAHHRDRGQPPARLVHALALVPRRGAVPARTPEALRPHGRPVRVIYRDGTLAIDFVEIDRVRFWDAKTNPLRPLRYRFLDPFGRLDPAHPLTGALMVPGSAAATCCHRIRSVWGPARRRFMSA